MSMYAALAEELLRIPSSNKFNCKECFFNEPFTSSDGKISV